MTPDTFLLTPPILPRALISATRLLLTETSSALISPLLSVVHLESLQIKVSLAMALPAPAYSYNHYGIND